MERLLDRILILILSCVGVFSATGSWNGVAFTAWNGIAQTSWNGTGISCAGGGSLQTPTVIHYVDTPASAQDAYFTNNNGVLYLPLPETNLAGQTIVLGTIFQGTSSSAVSLGDDKTNKWNQATYASDSTDGYYGYIWYATNIAAGTRMIQMTNTGSTRITNITVAALVANNILANSPLDGTNTARNSSSTTVSSGSITPSQSGDFFFQYARQVTGTVGGKLATASAQANTAFKLITANQTDAHWMQGGVYSSSSALNPQMTLDSAATTLSLAAAFKASPTTTGGTPSGMYIAGIHHEAVLNSVALNQTYQFPYQGNLLVQAWGSGGQNYIVTNVSDSASHTWTEASGGPTLMTSTGNGASDWWYVSNATANATLLVTNKMKATTPGHATIFVYDIVGAAASAPEDFRYGREGTSQTQASLTNVYNPQAMLPSVSGGITLASIEQDQNTVHDITGGYIDMTFWDGNNHSGPSQLDQNNGWAHFRPANATNSQGFMWNYAFTEDVANYTSDSIYFLPSGQVHVAPTYQWIQTTNNLSTSATTVTRTLPVNVTAGNLLVVGLQIGTTGRTITVTNTQGDTFSVASAAANDGQGDAVAMYYAKNVTGGACTVGVHVSGANTFIAFQVHEYKAPTTVTLDTVNATNFSSSDTPDSGNITTTGASGGLIIGFMSDGTGASHRYTAKAGYTFRASVDATSAWEDIIFKNTATISAGFTLQSGTSDSGRMVIISFK